MLDDSVLTVFYTDFERERAQHLLQFLVLTFYHMFSVVVYSEFGRYTIRTCAQLLFQLVHKVQLSRVVVSQRQIQLVELNVFEKYHNIHAILEALQNLAIHRE